MQIINDILYIDELIESDNNLIPFFDIGISTAQSSVDSELIIYTDETHTTVRRTLNNGLILNSPNSKLSNSFSNGKINITASGQTGAGYFTFRYDTLGFPILELGKKYAIVFDIEGNPPIPNNLIGFISNDDKTTIYNPSTTYINLATTGSNLNLYYIFTADSTIINDKNSFIFGWSNLTGLTINLYLTSLQMYCIDGLTEDITILRQLKGTALCNKKINSNDVLSISFKENGVVLASSFDEVTP